MDILANKSTTKQDEQTYRAWFEYADAGLHVLPPCFLFKNATYLFAGSWPIQAGLRFWKSFRLSLHDLVRSFRRASNV